MTKRSKSILQMLVAGVVGSIVGARLVAHRTASTVPPVLHFSRGMLAAIALIVLFSLYWSIAAKDSAPAQSSESAWSRQLHVIPLNLAVLLLMFSVPGLTHRFLPTSLLLTVAGLLVEAAGIAFAIWARRTLGANWSGEVRIASGHELVRTGPYRWIRHPIYTGILAMYLGAMLVSGEIHAAIAVVVIVLLYMRKIGLEEKILARNFGAEWDAWRRDSWALLPPLY